jgi:hypothetical protein
MQADTAVQDKPRKRPQALHLRQFLGLGRRRKREPKPSPAHAATTTTEIHTKEDAAPPRRRARRAKADALAAPAEPAQ